MPALAVGPSVSPILFASARSSASPACDTIPVPPLVTRKRLCCAVGFPEADCWIVLATGSAAAGAGRSRLWAGVRVWNIASLRVLNKLGFVSSGQVSEDLERGDMVLMTCRLEQPS